MAAPNAAVDDVVTARPLDGHVVAVPARPLGEAFGVFPGIAATVERDDEDRV